MNSTQDRYALYYPYIHFRNVNWLKSTLLCFGQVRRMVPSDFHLNDRDEIKELRDLSNDVGEPLIREEDTGSTRTRQAQSVLMDRLAKSEHTLRIEFTREQTERQYGQARDSFQIYRTKMHQPMLHFLQSRNLAWPARGAGWDTAEWFALHPRLGEAIMSLIAISIAGAKGLDIVTSEGHVHRALAAQSGEAVFNELLAGEGTNVNQPLHHTTDEVAMIVLTTHIDVSRITPKQIAELVQNRNDLRHFRDRVMTIASRVPDMPDDKEHARRLKDAAREVVDEWQKHRKAWPKAVLDAISGSAQVSVPDIATSLMAGATTATTLALSAGVGVGLVALAGLTVWRGAKQQLSGPTPYLSKVIDAGGVLASPPLVLQRA
jgi:hypothetical protein